MHAKQVEQDTLPDELFELVQVDERKLESITRPQLTFWQDAWRRLCKNKASFAGLIMIGVILVFALFGPYMSGFGFNDQNITRANLPPKIPVLDQISWLGVNGVDIRGIDQYEKKGVTESYWFGTDELGRDLWTRVWQGTRISLYIAILAAGIDLIIGVAYGGISAFYGGRVDNIMQRIIEVFVGVPYLIVVILLIIVLEPGIISMTIAMVITGWVGMARIVRGQILKLKSQEYVIGNLLTCDNAYDIFISRDAVTHSHDK